MAKVRLATVGTSGITERFIDAVGSEPRAELVACYSRSVEKARAFADRHGACLAFDSLEELAASSEVDAVYVASPNALHAAQAKTLIAGGKHVLVEKAFASNEAEAAGVFAAADEAGVVAMEAMRNIHTSTFDAIRREVAALGGVRLVNLGFSKVTSRIATLRAGKRTNIFDPHMSAGALCDMGIYCVAPAVALLGRPERIAACGVTAPVPQTPEDDPCKLIDLAGVISLGYDGCAASLTYGKVSDDYMPCQVAGEHGTLQWDQMGAPENLRVFDHEDKGLIFKMEKPEGRLVPTEVPVNDMVFEVADFVSAVQGDAMALEAAARFRQVTLDTLHVMDEARRQMGVTFPADL